ncbi:LysR family transcriptional regulator [Mesobacterium pallidum]|uniref:LysR family transcriptional regulator n=1 Tax=Mesobacterium pallidum TaxID=2872037 RepID=UPI001EE28EBB
MDRNLRAFLAIAAEGNLSKAADRIALAQPSLTKRLSNLESELGARLFTRHRRGMSLTAAGEKFLARARRIDQEYRQAMEEVRAIAGAGLDTLRIGAAPFFSLLYVAPLMARMHAHFPALTYDMVSDLNAVTLPMLMDGDLDVVLGPMETVEMDDLIAVIPVSHVELAVFLLATDPVCARGMLQPKDMAQFKWVAHSAATTNVPILRRYYATHRLGTPHIAARSTSFATALDVVRHMGLKMLAPLQISGLVESSGLRVLRTDPPIERNRTAAYIRKSSLDLPAVSCLIDELHSLVREREG